MSYLFLLPLLTAAIAAYFCQRSSDEIAYLTSVATVISLVLSLILAPWQIQLLILLTVVVIVTLLWQGREQKESVAVLTTETVAEKKYRGATHIEPTPAEASLTEHEGKYRGADVKITNNPSIAPPIRPSSLKYRGASSINSNQ
jgi:membrane protein implicated in regulation of membrane protease activity